MNLEKWEMCLRGGHKKTFKPDILSGTTTHPNKCIIMFPVDMIPAQNPDAKILDIGMGDGWTCNYMKNKFGCNVSGLTLSQQEADLANQRYPGIPYIVADVHDMPFDDNSFDVLLSRDSFEHFLSPFLALEEMWRILKPGGLLMLSLPCQLWQDYEEHLIVPNDQQMRHMLSLTGFEVIDYQTTNKETWANYPDELNKNKACGHVSYNYLCKRID